jgi:hypothetical protein
MVERMVVQSYTDPQSFVGIKFTEPVMYCSVGLPYVARLKTLPLSGGCMSGTSIGQLSVSLGVKDATMITRRALSACGEIVLEEDYLCEDCIGEIPAIKRVNSSLLLIALRAEAAGYYRLIAERHHRNKIEKWLNFAYA